MKRWLLSVVVLFPLLLWGMSIAASFVEGEPAGPRPALPIAAEGKPARRGRCPAPVPVAGRLENQIPLDRAVYLNQLSLSPEGNRQCGVASVAMALALAGQIEDTQERMAETANRLWHSYANPTTMRGVTQMLNDEGLAASMECLPPDEAWQRLKAQVDCQAPAIMASTRLTQSGSGHFVVVVGYREEKSVREIVTYDPFGAWAGPGQGYLLNASYAESSRGAGVVYNFDQAWGYGSSLCPGGYLLTVQPR